MTSPCTVRPLILVLIYLRMTSLLQAYSIIYFWSELSCPGEDNDLIRYSYMIPWGVPDRALKTAPPHIYIRMSRVPGAGLGAFAETFLKRGTWLGEYEGLSIPLEQSGTIDDWIYTFEVHRRGELHHWIDAIHLETSNWLRYINGARHPVERNVKAYQCYDKMFYILSRDVAPGTELLLYYGKEYYHKRFRDIDTSLFDNI